MPELPEVEIERRRLEPVLVRHRFDDVVVRRPDLRIPFPENFGGRLIGQTVLALDRRAKYLVASLGSHEMLLMHLGMSGTFRVDLDGGDDAQSAVAPGTHDHVMFQMSSGAMVTFNDPRRFGLIDLVPAEMLATHPVLSTLGPEPLSAEFDAVALARACRSKRTPLKVALLDQRVLAGLGNIYASEALYVARLSPRRQASTIATATGMPRPSAYQLAAAIKQVLTEAINRLSAADYRSSKFRVYDRENERCRRRGCGGRIQRRTQAGRSTFFCSVCQR